MALPIRDQAKYWGLALLVFFIALWALGGVILPFLVGGALAYFLDPVADRLERAGLSRVAATTVITAVGVLILVALVLAVIPTLVNQTTALINAAPDIAQRLQMFLLERFPELADNTSTIRQSLAQIGQTIQSKGASLAEGVLSSLAGAISIVVFILVVPVVAFYLLLDWDHMIARIDSLLPRDHAPTVRRLAGEIDAALSAFVRGQLSVCLVLGIYYSAALMMAGLQFGLVVGAIAGAITFIPYVGAIIGGALAIGLALFQFWGDWLQIGIIAAIAIPNIGNLNDAAKDAAAQAAAAGSKLAQDILAHPQVQATAKKVRGCVPGAMVWLPFVLFASARHPLTTAPSSSPREKPTNRSPRPGSRSIPPSSPRSTHRRGRQLPAKHTTADPPRRHDTTRHAKRRRASRLG
jgi:predicted PurR-regulated permease PerM